MTSLYKIHVLKRVSAGFVCLDCSACFRRIPPVNDLYDSRCLILDYFKFVDAISHVTFVVDYLKFVDAISHMVFVIFSFYCAIIRKTYISIVLFNCIVVCIYLSFVGN